MIITVKIESEVIAGIRNDLRVILGSTEVMLKDPVWSPKRLKEIIKRVHKIGNLLPGKNRRDLTPLEVKNHGLD